MSPVAKKEQLERVAADLARGHTHPALQRLANLSAQFPDDLDIRSTRAAVNPQIGNLVEAGRWGFLTEVVTAEEIAAFERSSRAPADRLRALRLGSRHQQLGPLAAQRLHDLQRQAGQPPQESRRPLEALAPILGCVVFLAAALGVLWLAIVGLVSLIR
jgi:Family of unknown function (DUF6584)